MRKANVMIKPSAPSPTQTFDNDSSSSSIDDRSSVHLQWKIRGMDCPSCAGKIEKALMYVEGVTF